MYLKTFRIKNFRSIKKLTLNFNKGLNVLIGENNSGKTTVIDALRLSLGIGSQRREIFMNTDDFYIDLNGNKSKEIEFDLIFSNPSIEEQGVFIEMLSINENIPEIQLHIRYFIDERSGIERIRFKYWGGENEGQMISPEAMGLFYYVHFDALRDANRDLSPSRGNRTSQLFLKLVGDLNEQKRYAETLQKKINEDQGWKELRLKGTKKVNEHLKEITILDSQQNIDISHVPFEFKKIVENLKMSLKRRLSGKEDSIMFEIYQNGMGYNNLIYISTVLGDILERKIIEKESNISLLIEEPEAHLHPQLQDILFNFLNDISEREVQIFLTSHSPTVTAKANLNSVIVLQIIDNEITSNSIKSCDLDDNDKLKLERFLDVTKSQLFFAKSVLLVEGITEALLIPILAEILGINLDKSGIEIVNVCGTAFKPFAKLFNSSDESRRLASKCAILTDGDEVDGNLSERAKKAKTLEQNNLRVFIAENTFEYELFKNGNSKILLDVYKEMHPKTEIGNVNQFLKKLKQNKDKAEFAQNLQIIIKDNQELKSSFYIPEYIKNAISWLVK